MTQGFKTFSNKLKRNFHFCNGTFLLNLRKNNYGENRSENFSLSVIRKVLLYNPLDCFESIWIQKPFMSSVISNKLVCLQDLVFRYGTGGRNLIASCFATNSCAQEVLGNSTLATGSNDNSYQKARPYSNEQKTRTPCLPLNPNLAEPKITQNEGSLWLRISVLCTQGSTPLLVQGEMNCKGQVDKDELSGGQLLEG